MNPISPNELLALLEKMPGAQTHYSSQAYQVCFSLANGKELRFISLNTPGAPDREFRIDTYDPPK